MRLLEWGVIVGCAWGNVSGRGRVVMGMAGPRGSCNITGRRVGGRGSRSMASWVQSVQMTRGSLVEKARVNRPVVVLAQPVV